MPSEVFEPMLCFFDSFPLRFFALRRVWRHLSLHCYQIPDPHKVISRHRELEYPGNLRNASVAQLPQQPYGLPPSKDLLYSFPLPLADCVPGVPRRSFIYCRPSPTIVLRNMRRHICLASRRHELLGVVSLVGPQRCSASTAYFVGEYSALIALCSPSRLRETGVDSESTSILHEQMPAIIELCFLPFSFLTQQSVRIGRGLMRLVGTFLPVEVNRRISRIIWWCFITTTFPLETFQPCCRLNQRSIDGEVLVAEQPVSSRLLKHLLEKRLGNVALDKSLTVLGERRRIPNVIVHSQTNEPAEQQVVVK